MIISFQNTSVPNIINFIGIHRISYEIFHGSLYSNRSTSDNSNRGARSSCQRWGYCWRSCSRSTGPDSHGHWILLLGPTTTAEEAETKGSCRSNEFNGDTHESISRYSFLGSWKQTSFARSRRLVVLYISTMSCSRWMSEQLA